MDYHDIDSNPVTLDTLCRKEPAWAANRIRAAERDRARLEALLEALRTVKDGCGAYCMSGLSCDEDDQAPAKCPIYLAAHSAGGNE